VRSTALQSANYDMFFMKEMDNYNELGKDSKNVVVIHKPSTNSVIHFLL
jgi:hypothetical protein